MEQMMVRPLCARLDSSEITSLAGLESRPLPWSDGDTEGGRKSDTDRGGRKKRKARWGSV